jgi:hypothetical protein
MVSNMKNIFKLLLLGLSMLSLVGVQPVLAAPQEQSQQDAKFSEWMTYYYIHKDTSSAPKFLQWLQTSEMIEKHHTAIQPTAAFLAIVFTDNKPQLQSWLKDSAFTGKTKETIEYALWLSGNDELITTIFKETPAYIKSSQVNLLSMQLKQPSDLDMMWGAFMASGNDQYVKKIVDVLDENIPLTGDKTVDSVTRASADWSLGSNMMQHELVNRLIRKEITTRPEAVKKKLEAIVARNEKNAKPFPNHNGDFSAMLVVTDESALKEFKKPSNEGMYLKESSKAKRGDILAIKIIFGGMELTDELMSDVTFDLKILDPDGKIYDGADNKGLEALKAKVPKRFSVFDNRSFAKIRFEPKDKLGKYQFIASIHDNIGKKSINLIKEVELVK